MEHAGVDLIAAIISWKVPNFKEICYHNAAGCVHVLLNFVETGLFQHSNVRMYFVYT